MDKYRQYVKQNKHKFIEHSISGKSVVDGKIAIFLAGTPGSGKTEVVSSLCALPSMNDILVRIDADIYRTLVPGYTPDRASDFQSAANAAVDIVMDKVIKMGYSFVLDATFASSRSINNVRRVLSHDYVVLMLYVLQEPEIAWNYTKIRQSKNDRNVPRDVFMKSCIRSVDNYLEVMHDNKFSDNKSYLLITKNYENNISNIIDDVASIDKVLADMYNLDRLKEIID